VFEFWGEYDYLRSNIHLPQDISDDTIAFLVELKKKTNVILHGPVSSNELANGLNRMDVLLINYNIKNDQNHHKVLEYLATGNVIVSNYMSSYCNDHSALIEMVCNPESNDELPGIFKKVVENLQYYNSEEMRAKRKNHACKFSYLNNLLLIQGFLEKINSN
ncbi:MAG TPA: hypothetical protein VM101_11970, partial [Flavitalea sp.]|nr:hypothetical protein [Flavitalea sp.]